MGVDASDADPAPTPQGLEVADVARDLDPEWDDVFAWSYGQRLWNVGCG